MAYQLKLVMTSQTQRWGLWYLTILSREPLLIVPRTEGEVYTRPAHLPELKGMPYHYYIDVHKPILIGDSKKITESRDVLDAPKLSHG